MFLNLARPKDASLSRRGDDVAVAEDWSEPMGKQYSKRSVSEVPCFCFGLAFHGEPDNWKKHRQGVVNAPQMHMKHDTWHIRYRQYPVASETLPRQFVYTSQDVAGTSDDQQHHYQQTFAAKQA